MLAAGLLAVGGPLLVAGTVHAEPPLRLPQQITDTAGALGGDTAELQASLDELNAAKGVQLWVAYVDSFDGLSGQEWADQTAALSGLGGNDMLFAVATGDRAYGYSVPADLPVSDAELERIIATQVEPQLAAGDWAGAAEALATSLAGSGSSGSDSAGSGGSAVPWLLGGAVVVIGGGAAVYFATRRKRGGSGDPAAPKAVPLDTLRQQAAAALIEVDDSIKTSEQELGFAIAQFGEAEAAPFRDVLKASRADLAQAFAIQAQVEANPDPNAARAGLQQIIDLCRAADDRLDAQVDRFDQMREMDRNIETILPDLGARAKAQADRIPTALTTTEALAKEYPPAALKVITENLDQAVTRVRFAQESVDLGISLVGSGDRAGAIARARAAEEAIGQATLLLDGVDRAPGDLATAKSAIAAMILETEKDIAEAERLGGSPPLAPHAQHARETLAWARSVTESGNYDPVATRRALEDSDNALEAALGPVREAAAAAQRARELLVSATDSARASINAADDFITTRRGAVGAAARTSLAEAERAFAEGTSGPAANDPQSALAAMQRADQMADRALAQAQQDELAAQQRQVPQGRSGGGLDMGSIVLGGILIDSMTRGGGLGGRSGGGGGRQMPNPPSGGSRGPGSFGGGGTRGRRGGGGRF